jgi:hypothetical protein
MWLSEIINQSLCDKFYTKKYIYEDDEVEQTSHPSETMDEILNRLSIQRPSPPETMDDILKRLSIQQPSPINHTPTQQTPPTPPINHTPAQPSPTPPINHTPAQPSPTPPINHTPAQPSPTPPINHTPVPNQSPTPPINHTPAPNQSPTQQSTAPTQQVLNKMQPNHVAMAVQNVGQAASQFVQQNPLAAGAIGATAAIGTGLMAKKAIQNSRQ